MLEAENAPLAHPFLQPHSHTVRGGNSPSVEGQGSLLPSTPPLELCAQGGVPSFPCHPSLLSPSISVYSL